MVEILPAVKNITSLEQSFEIISDIPSDMAKLFASV